MQALLQNFPKDDFAILGLILALPLLGAFVNGVFGKRLGKEGVRTMALSVMALAFFGSVATFLAVTSISHEEGELTRLSWTAWEWFSVTGPLRRSVTLDVAFSVDPLTATMMLVVTGVGFLIHLYSTGYMAKDKGYYRFFAYLNLFIFSMLVLILGDNLVVLFVGWEGVGLCSYLLIGFWFTDEKKAAAGKKAFITNRIGDFGLLLAMSMLIYYAGTLTWDGLSEKTAVLTTMVQVWPIGNLQASALPLWLADFLTPAEPVTMSVATLVSLALFLGCVGKSAQIPLYVWLPDAMAGPTPVSALIHAATMVTAGVYLVCRCSFIFVLSPAAMAIIAGTGALTALLAATIAFTQTDLKKVLAYSTVSQLGFMFIGVGVGAFGPGFFHVITHAFFKGCLFLCAGSVIHAMHEHIHDEVGSQDMRNMGGLKKYMPVTHATYLIACLAIAGCPPLSGFWSKDEILFKAYTNTITGGGSLWMPPAWFGQAIYAIGLIAAIGTAFYMFRSYFLTFHGSFKGWKIDPNYVPPKKKHHHSSHPPPRGHDHEHDEEIIGGKPHESPLSMTIPLMVLAGLALTAGFLMAEPIHVAPLHHFWEPVFAQATRLVGHIDGAEGMLYPLLGAGVAAFAIGSGGAYFVYVVQKGAPAKAFAKALGPMYGLIHRKWMVDELYEATAIGMIDAMGDTAAQFDKWVIDGIIAKLTAFVTRLAGSGLRLLQTGRVQVYAAAMVIGVAAMGWFLFNPQANADLTDGALRKTGTLDVTAAPGHGYTYKIYVEGQDPPKDFTKNAKFSVPYDHCETKTVHVEVQNMLGRVDTESYTRCRELFPGCCRAEGTGGIPMPNASSLPRGPGGGPIAPGTYGPDMLKDLLKGRRPTPLESGRPQPKAPPKGGNQ